MVEEIKKQVKLNTNNWRKMHGLPMLKRKNKKSFFNLNQIENPTLFVEIDDFKLIKKFYEKK